MINHFQSESLQYKDIVPFTLYFSAFYIFIFALCRLTFHEKKKLSWVITLMNSGMMTILGSIYICIRYILGDRFYPFIDDISPLLYRADDFSVIICVMYTVATSLDLILGALFYPEYFRRFNGWFHHIIIIWLLRFSITTDGIFMTTASPFSPIFVYSLIQEFPTFILALGSIFPTWRADLGFGLVYFLLRIVYHSFLFSVCYHGKAMPIILATFCVTLSLHIVSFYGWTKSYSKKRRGIIVNAGKKAS